MNRIFLFVIPSADPLIDNFPLEWQDRLMNLFLENISFEGLQILSKNCESQHYCDKWKGIKCQGEKVNKIHYASFCYGNFNLSALPNWTKYIWIFQCKQRFQLSTRCLPKHLQTLSISANELFGSVDLTSLPNDIRTVRLWGNRISGSIDLTKLPKTIKFLDLYQNEIHQGTVWYGNLPATIKIIKLKKFAGHNKIGEVRSIDSENTVDIEIFRGMKKKHIH